MKDKIIALIAVITITLLGVFFIHAKISEKKDTLNYSVAINEYRAKNYQKAYKDFGKISVFSEIKAPALFRQARCAYLVGDIKGAKRNYSMLLFLYPNSQFYVVSEYNLASILYNCHDKSARKYFTHIIKYYPETDYALASEYYIACIDMESAQKSKLYIRRKNLKKKALDHFIKYIKKSPDGRFAQQAADNVSKLGIALTKEENLVLASYYYKREMYNEASKYFVLSPLNISWAMYADNEYKRKNYSLSKTLTENGLKYFSAEVEKENIYAVLENYISDSENKTGLIDELLSKFPASEFTDYLLYQKAINSDDSKRYEIYESLYTKYPNSSFASEALYENFYKCIDKKQYDKALKIGQKHILNFKQTDTAPAVLFWMGKIYERKNNKSGARSYYKSVITGYPDSYYSYRAYIKLNNNVENLPKTLSDISVEFPEKSKKEQRMASKLIELGDYDFILELYKGNKFVESWIEYKKGNYTYSSILAEKEMKNIYPKPRFSDVRWRLVYPIHYWRYIDTYKGNQNPIILLSIMREESHFNPKIESSVGAIGLMQLMRATANELASAYGLDKNLYNPETNIKLGSLYYSSLVQSLSNNNTYAIMSYNGGRSNTVKWLNKLSYEDIDDFVEKIPFKETKSYVKKVLRSYWCYCNVY